MRNYRKAMRDQSRIRRYFKRLGYKYDMHFNYQTDKWEWS